MYKALISDIDNTLVGVTKSDSELDAQTVQAVGDAIDRGIHIGLATGRGWMSTRPIAARLQLVDPCIIEGGGCIIDPRTERPLWEKFVSADMSTQIVDVFKEYAPWTALVKSSGNSDRLLIGDVGNYAFENRVIYLLGVSLGEAEVIQGILNELPLITATLTTPSWAGSGLYDVHVTHEHGTKRHALEAWRKLVGVERGECVGMGDSANDLPLFDGVGLKVAVGNATEDLKARADYIAPQLHEGALKNVLATFFTP